MLEVSLELDAWNLGFFNGAHSRKIVFTIAIFVLREGKALLTKPRQTRADTSPPPITPKA